MSTGTQQGSQQKVWTVSEVTQGIKRHLEYHFTGLCMRGEISNFKAHSSGHFYFSIKDPGAQISAVMFRGNQRSLLRRPKEGDQVTVVGDISVYPPRGNYQILVREMHFSGTGELLQRLHALKAELEARGWFAPEHKKPLPRIPGRIGVITSPTGAAIQDMLNVLNRRHSGFQLLLNPVQVQGPQAAPEIAAAIRQMNEHNLADVLIVGRGGGSIEDLWAFNEEIVAKAIFESRIPVISAVGHEVDWCLSDFVADVRAPTPSAAAEIVTAEKNQHLEMLKGAQNQIARFVLNKVQMGRQQLNGVLRHPLFLSPYTLLGPYIQQLDEANSNLNQELRSRLERRRLQLKSLEQQSKALSPGQKIHHYRTKLNYLNESLNKLLIQGLALRSQKLKGVNQTIRSIDPKNLTRKGYSILLDQKSRKAITSKRDLSKGQKIQAVLVDGEATLAVEELNS